MFELSNSNHANVNSMLEPVQPISVWIWTNAA